MNIPNILWFLSCSFSVHIRLGRRPFNQMDGSVLLFFSLPTKYAHVHFEKQNKERERENKIHNKIKGNNNQSNGGSSSSNGHSSRRNSSPKKKLARNEETESQREYV